MRCGRTRVRRRVRCPQTRARAPQPPARAAAQPRADVQQARQLVQAGQNQQLEDVGGVAEGDGRVRDICARAIDQCPANSVAPRCCTP
jgi:hypothetical protein